MSIFAIQHPSCDCLKEHFIVTESFCQTLECLLSIHAFTITNRVPCLTLIEALFDNFVRILKNCAHVGSSSQSISVFLLRYRSQNDFGVFLSDRSLFRSVKTVIYIFDIFSEIEFLKPCLLPKNTLLFGLLKLIELLTCIFDWLLVQILEFTNQIVDRDTIKLRFFNFLLNFFYPFHLLFSELSVFKRLTALYFERFPLFFKLINLWRIDSNFGIIILEHEIISCFGFILAKSWKLKIYWRHSSLFTRDWTSYLVHFYLFPCWIFLLNGFFFLFTISWRRMTIVSIVKLIDNEVQIGPNNFQLILLEEFFNQFNHPFLRPIKF